MYCHWAVEQIFKIWRCFSHHQTMSRKINVVKRKNYGHITQSFIEKQHIVARFLVMQATLPWALKAHWWHIACLKYFVRHWKWCNIDIVAITGDEIAKISLCTSYVVSVSWYIEILIVQIHKLKNTLKLFQIIAQICEFLFLIIFSIANYLISIEIFCLTRPFVFFFSWGHCH